ncbi:hypothetical protein ACFFVF_17520, partial [Flavobacterium jumunjinense]
NQLVKVDDSSNSPQGFKDGTNTDNDFFYDANGNMTKDNNKGIGSITYNHLNLPAIIDFGSKGKIEYIYNAIGTKLEKRVTSTPEATWTNPFPTPVTNKTTYLAGFQYKDNQLEFFPHAEGYVKYQYSENSYSYVFNYTDHLGNIRVSYSDIDKNGILGNERNIGNCRIETDRKGNPSTVCDIYITSAILEESHYYPFGLKHEGYNSNNQQPNYNYKYNGQEWQSELGLNV